MYIRLTNEINDMKHCITGSCPTGKKLEIKVAWSNRSTNDCPAMPENEFAGSVLVSSCGNDYL